MDYLVFKSFLPEIFLSSCILFQLLINVLLVNNFNFPILLLESISQTFFILSCVFVLLWNNKIEGYFLNYLFINESNGNCLKLLFILNALIVLLIIAKSFKFYLLNFFEYFFFYLLVILAALLLFNAMDMLSAYLVLEMQTLTFFVLAAFKRNSVFSIEAGIKYFIVGAIISAFFLFGCSLCYGYFGTLNFFQLNIIVPFLINNIQNEGYYFVLCALLFIIVVFLFKFAIVPFHFWAPDVYEGSPLASTIIFSIIPKLALLHFFIKWLYLSLMTFPELFWVMVSTGLASVVVGIFYAMGQKRLKRFIIYSSIAQSGFLIVSLSNITIISVVASYFFLVNYLVTAIIIWALVSILYYYKNDFVSFYNSKITPFYLSDFSAFFKKNNSWGFLILLVFFSLMGIPPFTGFFAKAFIFYGLIISNINYFAIVLILINAIATFYYLRFIKIVFFDTKNFDYLFYHLHTFFNSNRVFYIIIISSTILYLLLAVFFEPGISFLFCYKASISTFSGF